MNRRVGTLLGAVPERQTMLAVVSSAMLVMLLASFARAQTADDLYRDIARSSRNGDLATIERMCEELQRKFPTHNRTGCATVRLGLAYRRAGKLDDAEKALRRAMTQYADCRFGDGGHVGGDAMYRLVMLFVQKGKADEARSILKQLTERYPDVKNGRGFKYSDMARDALERPQVARPRPGKRPSRRIGYAKEFDFLWQKVRDTYPYFEDKKIDWDAIGKEFRERVKDVSNHKDFILLCMEMMQRLEDGHSYLQTRYIRPDQRGNCGIALAPFGQTEAIVLRVEPGGAAEKAGCRPGWVLTEVDGATVSQRVQQERRKSRRGYSTPWLAWHRLMRQMTLGPPESIAQLKFRLPEGEARTLAVKRSSDRFRHFSERQWIHPPDTQEGKHVDVAVLPDDIAYVHVRRLIGRGGEPGPELRVEFENAMKRARSAGGCILDLRGNSGGATGVGKWVLGHFVDQPVKLPTWGSLEPQQPGFQGKVAVLIDSGTFSAADGTAAICSWVPRRFPLLGKPTAGSSGEQVSFEMPSGLFKLRIASKRIVDHRGLPIEGRGTQPSIPLEWRPEDLAQGEDSFIKQAKEYLCGDQVAASMQRPKVQFALRDVFGREVRAADYMGVPLLVEFGACW